MKCFNPSKNWQLGWYNDKALGIGLGESWIGRLVAFVDYDLADPSRNAFVLLRIGEFLFVQYNRAKDFNAGTSRHQDEVVVVVGEGGLTSSSVLRAGLATRERYSWKGTTIQVCSFRFDPSSMDYAEVAVYPTGRSVSTFTFPPTSSPSFGTSPTLPPSAVATVLPTPLPTLVPTPLVTFRVTGICRGCSF